MNNTDDTLDKPPSNGGTGQATGRAASEEPDRTLRIKVSATVYSLLEVLGRGRLSVEETVGELIDHAQQGAYRPSSWERPWICRVFGYDWLAHMEPGDPYRRMHQLPPGVPSVFQRPKAQG